MRRTLSALFVLLGCAFAALPARAIGTDNLDGTWEGVLHVDKDAQNGAPDAASFDAKLRLSIHGPVVDATTVQNSITFEFRPGALHIAQVMTNAVIFGTNFAGDEKGGWTETWTIAATKLDNGKLLVEFLRLVNNSGFRDKEKNVKFGVRGAGELALVGP